jgi:hypothetical protein
MGCKGRADYHDEIERICDIAAAAENARLMRGGRGVGDRAEGVEHEGALYDFEGPDVEDVVAELYAPNVDAPVPVGHETGEAEIQRRLDEIRGRVMSYPEQIRLDIGYLLTVIDAYESGRL